MNLALGKWYFNMKGPGNIINLEYPLAQNIDNKFKLADCDDKIGYIAWGKKIGLHLYIVQGGQTWNKFFVNS